MVAPGQQQQKAVAQAVGGLTSSPPKRSSSDARSPKTVTVARLESRAAAPVSLPPLRSHTKSHNVINDGAAD